MSMSPVGLPRCWGVGNRVCGDASIGAVPTCGAGFITGSCRQGLVFADAQDANLVPAGMVVATYMTGVVTANERSNWMMHTREI